MYHDFDALRNMILMQFRTASMTAMLAITKHGVCVGIMFGQFHNGRHGGGTKLH